MTGAAEGAVGIGHNSGGRVQCIFRGHGERGYTKLKNTFLQDRRISDETRGLVARLLSLPDDWEVTVKSIIASGKAGRDKVYRMIAEAETFGYIRPDERKRQADGTLGRQVYLVSDDPEELVKRAAEEIFEIETGFAPYPENPEVDYEPLPDQPDTVNPDVAETLTQQGLSPRTAKPDLAEPRLAKPLPENPDASKSNIGLGVNNNPPIVPPAEPKPKRQAVPDQYPSDFEQFWREYPRREGKAGAYKSWKRLTVGQRRRALDGVMRQKDLLTAKANSPRGNFCAFPATWLNQGRYDDEPTTHAQDSRPMSYAEEEIARRREFMKALES